ncbi:ABC transporter substrate-binding protein [Nesterenkonia sp. NBAIMH1]|uniref:ABC transporter substrate-binding protein n=1 Tax=Nesterenkonia sp. NBAIMH1 TaxID=2600320 RepID=UPI001FEDC6EF|nr:ABC transporter substrate-binding protein [Nesterenkonia sp. NBAIMH1]
MLRTDSTRRWAPARQTMLLTAGIAALTLSACNGDGDAEGGAEPGDDGELTPIEVGALPIVDTAPLYVGVEEGIFEDHGLDVTITQAQGGAALLPAVTGGDMDFGFSNVTSLVIAHAQGLDIDILAGGSATTGDPDEDFASVVVSEDSDIEEIEDLEGASIAVNTLSNISDSTISEAVEQAGGNSDAIDFVEMPFPDMPAALESGQVDAAASVEPFQTITRNDGARSVFSNYANPIEDLTVAVWFTAGTYAEENPEITEAFTEAMGEAQTFADENHDVVRETLPTYMDSDEQVLEELTLAHYPAAVNEDSLQQINDISADSDIIPEPIDIEELFNEYSLRD